MKALIYKRYGSADELEWTDDWPLPEISADTVLIKVVAGSVNPKDVLLRKGKFSRTFARGPLPKVSGLDVAGEIVAMGSLVRGFSMGDLVFGMTNVFAGGVHSEIAKLHQSEIADFPKSSSLFEASSVPLAAQTALQALRDCCHLKEGQKILINGASGGVGHFAVQIAKVMGAEVHAVCGSHNFHFVQSLGADCTYSYKDQSATEIDLAFDSVFDVFGNFTGSEFRGQLGRNGVYVSTVPKAPSLWGETLARLGISKVNRLVQVRSRSEDLKQLKKWIESKLVLPHVEKIYRISQAAAAHRHVESKHTIGKVCIDFSS